MLHTMCLFTLQTSSFDILSFEKYYFHVDTSVFSLKLTIDFSLFYLEVQFDVTFPALRCSVLSLDAMDISGEQQFDIVCISRRLYC